TTGKDSRDSNSNDTKSADTKSSKNDTASKTGKDSRDSNSNDTKSADTKSSKNDTASKTGKDDKHHSDEKTSKGPDSKTAGPTAPKGGKDDGKDDGGAKTPKPDGSAGDGGAAKADPGSVKPGGGPKPDDNGPAPGGAAPGGGSTPGGPVGPGGTRGADPADAKGADTKFRGAKVSGLVGAAPEPAAPQTPPDRKGPDDKFRKPKTAPAGPVKPGAAGPKPAPAGCAPANPETKATPTSANGPATRDGRTTMNDPSNAAAGMVPVSGSTADLANEPPAAPAAGPVIAPSPTRIPAQAGSPDAAATAEPVQHVHAGADSVTFAAPDGAGHTMSRGEVRTLKQFERRLAAKGQVLAKVAEGSKDIRATAVDQATRAQRLAEDAKQVKGGDRLVAMAQRLAERVQTLRAKAEQTEKGAERGTEAVKALASNAEKRHGVIYKAVVDSPLTSPAEREFYQDKEGS
ncbi:hypothetical protein, partial [Kitasatospora aureofaciens]|uniref:hypothetical protein n=1 Tax=Kitasatospora aureofaciens TaxID=1894 RepID=UPI0033E83CBF